MNHEFDMRPFDLMTASEINIAIDQEPGWELPLFCIDRKRRMAEAHEQRRYDADRERRVGQLPLSVRQSLQRNATDQEINTLIAAQRVAEWNGDAEDHHRRS